MGGKSRPNRLKRLEKRFWAKVKKCESGCWEWTASTNHGSYGNFTVPPDKHHGPAQRAHRVSWFLHTGKWPTKNILHTCDNPPCIRFEHLYEGTALNNAQDRDSRGRQNSKPAIGERNGKTVLNETKVRIIRLTNLPDEIWAERFGVSRDAVNGARIGRTWYHLKNSTPIRRRPKYHYAKN